jgi:hypothetical protein
MTSAQLEQLARDVEAHLSPELRAHFLQGDLAIATALHELVDLERAKLSTVQMAALVGTSLKARTTLYPDKHPRAGIDPAFSGTLRLAGRAFRLKAWIGSNQEFINIELAVL